MRAATTGVRISRISRRAQQILAAAASVLLAIALVSAGASPTAAVPSKPKPQKPIITTIAGGFGDGSPAAQTSIGTPIFMTADAAGNLYVAEAWTTNRIIKIVPSGRSSTVAGNGFRGDQTLGGYGDGGPATAARLTNPNGVALDKRGNLYITDTYGHRIRKVDAATGIITTIAGTGTFRNHTCADPSNGAALGDGDPAIDACLQYPTGIVVDSTSNLFFADNVNNRVRRIDAATGVITTVAGTGKSCSDGDGGQATRACLVPNGLAFDSAGNLYISDSSYNRIRKIDSTTGVITTIAGSGAGAYCGDGGPATKACLNAPSQIALDSTGNLYIADTSNHRLRKVDVSGTISTIAGGPDIGYGVDNGDGGPATQAKLTLPRGVAVDATGAIFVSEWRRIRRIDPATQTITTFAGNGYESFSGDGGAAKRSQLAAAAGVAVDKSGNVFVADQHNNRIRRIDAATGTITTVAGTGPEGYVPSSQVRTVGDPSGIGDGGPATKAYLLGPYDVALDASGNLLIADTENQRIRKVDANGIITTIAGTGLYGSLGDGGLALAAELANPMGVATDTVGNVYIADWGTCRIRKINTAGIITTVAGTGQCKQSPVNGPAIGDGGGATQAPLSYVTGVAVDQRGNVYIVDSGLWADNIAWRAPNNQRIRKVDAATGIITTIAGNGTRGYCGDGGPATQACLYAPAKVAVDPAGNIFISDLANYRIRRIDAATATITTVAGIGVRGWTGDGGRATTAQLAGPHGLALTPAGDLYFTDLGWFLGWRYFASGPDLVRKITAVAQPQ